MAVTFTLRAKQGVKVGTYISDDFGTHDVVVRPAAPTWRGAAYTVEVDSKPVAKIERSGNGRNLTWYVDNAGAYGGTLESATARAVGAHLSNQHYAAQTNDRIAQIKVLLPYEVDSEEAAVDTAFSSEGQSGVVLRSHGHWYIGFYSGSNDTDTTKVVEALKAIDRVNANDIRVYDFIDPRVVIEALKEQGVSAHFSSDRTEVQIYGVTGNLVLHIAKDGEVTAYTPADGGTREDIVGAARNEEQAVRAAVRWYKSYDLQVRAEALLKHLETEVPDGVAHYAVEDAKKALRTLARTAHTVDFTYERKVTVL